MSEDKGGKIHAQVEITTDHQTSSHALYTFSTFIHDFQMVDLIS